MEKTNETEPPPFERPQVFMIGQDSRRNWVVRDQKGLRGGLFIGYAEALRYVRDEAGNHPQTLVMVDGAFELDTSEMSRPAMLHQFNAEKQRAVA